ncbi:MMPL family transporter [Thiosocius teredinicola]|uniref:MMPL family transporter n=1 Tax=Thiosocius teredinicola TaxID=1973002 RepID=UPI000990C2E3
MIDDSLRPAHAERSRQAVAFVHEGFFVYANQPFLERLGYKTFEDLEAVPLLDLVEGTDHERLREHLEAAKQTAGTDAKPPEARLLLRRADDLPLSGTFTSFRTRYAGEDCVQLNLKTREDSSLKQVVQNLPWRLYLSLIFLVLFTVLPSTMLLKLNIDNSPSVYFPDDEPAVVLDNELKERFPGDQVFLLVFDGVALYSDGFLEAYDQLGKALHKLPLIDDVISVTNQDHIRGGKDSFIVEPLIDVRELENSRPKARQQHILGDRFAKGALISQEGNALAMVVIPGESGNSLERLEMEGEIMAAVDDARLSGYLTAVAGWIPVDVAELKSMLSDNAVFIPATVITGLLLIWWLFRRWLAVILAGVAISVVVNSTVAIYVLLDQPFTLVSSIISPMLSALTVAALVHLFNALYQASRHGYTGRERVERALEEIDKPAMFAALTTAAGLASLGTSPIVPIKVFGLFSACGVALIYVVVYRVLPNVCVRWDRTPWPRVKGGLSTMDHVVRSMAYFGMRHPLIVIVFTLGGLAFGLPQLAKVKVETNFQEYFPYEHTVRAATRLVDEQFVGTMPLEVSFNAAQRDGLVDHTILQKMRDFQAWAKSQPEIDRTFSMVDFIEEMNWAFNAEKPEFRKLPDDDQLISQYLLVYDGEDLFDFVDRDYQHAHIVLNLNVHSANEISGVMDKIRAYLGEHVGDQVDWEIAGAGRLFADMEDLLVAGQVYSLWGALVLIYVFMLILWRTPWGAALCMIPNLSPILLIFIIMGLFGIWLDMATAMIASVAVGIAVDDTIHVYHGVRNRIQNGISPVIAMARAYREAGRAVVVTTIILSAQFLILVTSDFVPTRNFGLLTTIGLIAALVFDLVLLPALLIVIFGRNSAVAAWLARLPWAKVKAAVQTEDAAEPGFDRLYWTPERRVALVREVMSGKMAVAAAAREYNVPEDKIEKWVERVEQSINDTFSDKLPISRRDPAKVRALAKAYQKLKIENRVLKAKTAELESDSELADEVRHAP